MAKLAAIAITLSFVAACQPEPGPAGSAAVPKIQAFSATSINPTSPALVTLSWKLKGLGSQSATCRIESDDPTFQPIDITGCRAQASRNVAATTTDATSTYSYSLTVNTSNGFELSAQTNFDVSPGSAEPFDIDFFGLNALAPDVAAAAIAAGARWEQVIVGGFPDTTEFPSWCESLPAYPLPASIDDLLIYIDVVHQDGPGGTLASAGPRCILLEGERALTGVISIDEADVDSMIADGMLVEVLAHEIGHILGIGTLWETANWGTRHLISGSGTSNPRFTGPAATAEWHKLGGEGAVPLEAGGGSGTLEAHWSESVFGSELMTGWIDPSPQLSSITAASLADIGFNVDLDAADPYALPNAGAGMRPSRAGVLIEGERFTPIPMFTP